MDTSAPEPAGPRADRPLRRSFSPAQKLEHLTAYDAACQRSEGGAYLRSAGLFSSQITEWPKLRDAGVLAGKQPGERVGRPSAEQAEIARLRRELDRAEAQVPAGSAEPSQSSAAPSSAAPSSTPSATTETSGQDTAVTITAGDQTFEATINDSQVSRDLLATLPMTLSWERNAGIEYITELPAPLTETGPF